MHQPHFIALVLLVEEEKDELLGADQVESDLGDGRLHLDRVQGGVQLVGGHIQGHQAADLMFNLGQPADQFLALAFGRGQTRLRPARRARAAPLPHHAAHLLDGRLRVADQLLRPPQGGHGVSLRTNWYIPVSGRVREQKRIGHVGALAHAADCLDSMRLTILRRSSR